MLSLLILIGCTSLKVLMCTMFGQNCYSKSAYETMHKKTNKMLGQKQRRRSASR